MLQSMTGFGKAIAESDKYKVTVETRSVNSKQADVSMRLPAGVRSIEMDLRRKVTSELGRGKIDVFVNIDKLHRDGMVSVDTVAAKHYWEELKRVHRETSIPLPQDPMRSILSLPGIVVVLSDDDEDLELIELVNTAVDSAIREHKEFRIREGNALEGKFVENIETIRTLLSQVIPFESERIDNVRARLQEGLKKHTDNDYDPSRMEQEMIFYIEKLDITEEKQRLKAHLNYFLETMQRDKSQGRKLGFIAQEIGREINTLGSKANHAEIQKLVVKMKDQLEQIKEQVLNIL